MSKMGQRDLRRLLVLGAMAVIQQAARRGAPEGSWLARTLRSWRLPEEVEVGRKSSGM